MQKVKSIVVISTVATLIPIFSPALPAQQSPRLVRENTGMVDAVQTNVPTPGPQMDRVISVRLNRVPLDLALQEISRRADVGLVYSRDVLPTDKRVSLDADRVTLRDALTIALRGTPLKVSVSSSGQVTIIKPVVESKRAQDKGIVSGRVLDVKTKRPIEGLYVSIEGSRISTRTNDDGRFSIKNLEPGTYTLVVRGIGYTRATKQITITEGGTVVADFELNETLSTLDAVIVTSTVAETDVRSVPVDITVISSKQIQDNNITRIEQLFRGMVPGVYMADQGYISRNPGLSPDVTTQRTPQVRGQNFLSADATTPGLLKTYIDGVLVTDYSVVTQIDPAMIDRIEIVRGPAASTMYGSGASDGVVQIFTKRGRAGNAPQIIATLSTTAFQSPYKSDLVLAPEAKLSVTGGGESFSYSGSGSYRREGAWVPNYKSESKSINGGLQWNLGPVTGEVSVGYDGPNRYNDVTGAWIALGVYEGRYSRAKIYTGALAPSNSVSEFTSTRYGGNFTYLPWQNWSHHLNLGINGSATNSQRNAPAFTSITDTLLNWSTNDRTMRTISYNNVWQASFLNDFESGLTTGFEYNTGESNSINVGGVTRIRQSGSGTYPYVNRDYTRNAGYFGSWVLGYRNTVFFTAGVRFEQNPDYGSNVKLRREPRVGLSTVFERGDVSVKPRIAYGWANRPPQAFWKDGDPGYTYVSGDFLYQYATAANPGLLPSEQSGVEGGFDLFVGNWLSLSVTGYNQMVRNDIFNGTIQVDTVALPAGDVAPYKLTSISQYYNIGRMQSRGVELSGSVQWRQFQVQSTYSTASNIIRTIPPSQQITPVYGAALTVGDRLPWVPTFTGGTQVTYTDANTSATFNMSYVGRAMANDQLYAFNRQYGTPEYSGPSLPGRSIMLGKWTKYDLTASRHLGRKVDLLTQILNLTNSRQVEGLDTRSPLEGRQYILGFRIRN